MISLLKITLVCVCVSIYTSDFSNKVRIILKSHKVKPGFEDSVSFRYPSFSRST